MRSASCREQCHSRVAARLSARFLARFLGRWQVCVLLRSEPRLQAARWCSLR